MNVRNEFLSGTIGFVLAFLLALDNGAPWWAAIGFGLVAAAFAARVFDGRVPD